MKRLLLGGLGALALVTVTLTVYIDAQPTPQIPEVDAVFTHAGGTGERLEASLDLWEAMPASTMLVLPNGNAWEEGGRWCESDDPRVLCDSPVLDTTLGEARLLRDLAERFDWRNVAVVTSDYHLRRAMSLDSRCTDARLFAASAGHEVGPVALVGKYIHEFGGLAVSAVQRCDP